MYWGIVYVRYQQALFNNFLIQLSVSIIIHILQLRTLMSLKEVKSPKDEKYFLKLRKYSFN